MVKQSHTNQLGFISIHLPYKKIKAGTMRNKYVLQADDALVFLMHHMVAFVTKLIVSFEVFLTSEWIIP